MFHSINFWLSKNDQNWRFFGNLNLQDFWGKFMTPKIELLPPADQTPPQWSAISKCKKNSFKKIPTRFPDMYVASVLFHFAWFSDFYFGSKMRQKENIVRRKMIFFKLTLFGSLPETEFLRISFPKLCSQKMTKNWEFSEIWSSKISGDSFWPQK